MPSMAESRRTLHSLEKSSEAHSIAPQTSLQFTNEYALFIWKGERRKRIGYFSSKISPSSGGDHHKLFAAFLAEVGDWSGVRAGFEVADPSLLAGSCIEGAEAAVCCSSDKYHSARGHDRSAEIWCARRG